MWFIMYNKFFQLSRVLNHQQHKEPFNNFKLIEKVLSVRNWKLHQQYKRLAICNRRQSEAISFKFCSNSSLFPNNCCFKAELGLVSLNAFYTTSFPYYEVTFVWFILSRKKAIKTSRGWALPKSVQLNPFWHGGAYGPADLYNIHCF